MNLKDTILNETVIHGGLPLTRGNVYRDVIETTGDQRAADYFAFSKPAVDLEPMSWDQFQGIVNQL